MTLPNEFRTVFELEVQRLGTLEELEIPDILRQVGATSNFAQYVMRSIHIQSDLHRILFARFLRFLYHCNPLYRNINSITILGYRTTVHVSYSNENKLGRLSTIIRGTKE